MLKLYHNDMSSCAQKVRIMLAEKGLPWESVHLSFLDSLRPASQTIQILKRMCWWETMSSDADDWYLQCQIWAGRTS